MDSAVKLNSNLNAKKTSNSAVSRLERFEFRGNGSEYFGIWIVNILLSIFTLGVYSAWAKVRNKQYFYGNTYLDGSSFEYTAQPVQILKGRAIAFLFFVLYQLASSYLSIKVNLFILLFLMLVTPWIIVRSMAFNARYTQYKNIRFGFNSDMKSAFIVFFLIPLLMLAPAIIYGLYAYFSDTSITNLILGVSRKEGDHMDISNILIVFVGLGLLMYAIYPFTVYVTKKFLVNNHRYGTADFKLRLDNSKPVYLVYGWLLVAIILMFIGFWSITSISSSIYGGEITSEAACAENSECIWSAIFGVLFPFAWMLIYFAIFAYVSARIYNIVYQKSSVGPHKLRANMPARGLMWIYFSNSLGILFTLGLFIPWAKVRSARFRAKHTALRVQGNLDEFIADEAKEQAAFGEEFGELFDIDVAI